ncbi:unnamed protein product [Sphenostylis stenocarpa]|uniref:Miraculin-like n=1 Tax=Sphenostylis stenocarpa TaxID=92480 RepID=A0AA86STH5_9FABA|nr:unnamed protein product [Sphenostylis stenocarpa]
MQLVDTSGKKVRADGFYYIVPASSDVGSLALSTTGVVRVSTDLNIYFSTYTTCPQSIVWMLKDYDYSTSQWFVTTGGGFGNPGPDTIRNWFKIEKYEDAYKLVYCPSVCNDCSYPCSDIGIYQDQYGKRLALSSQPYKVQCAIVERIVTDLNFLRKYVEKAFLDFFLGE